MLPYTNSQIFFGCLVLCFWVLVILILSNLFLVSLLFFLGGFLVFRQGGRCKRQIGHFRKRSEAIGNFGNFRKDNLLESSEGPRSEPI